MDKKHRLGIVAVDLDIVAREGLEKLHVFNPFRRLEILHEHEYTCCGLCIKSHKYKIFDQNRQMQFTATQDIQTIVINFINHPVLIIHLGAPKFFDSASSCIAVTLPSEILLGSITREDKTEPSKMGESTIRLRVLDPTGTLIMTTEQSGYTATGDNQHLLFIENAEVGRIGSTRGKATLLYGRDLSFEAKALMLAAAIWMEILERKKPRWRNNK